MQIIQKEFQFKKYLFVFIDFSINGIDIA